MTTSQMRWKCMVAAVILVVLPVSVHADNPRTGDEPWFHEVAVEQQQQAQALFEQAVDKHELLLRDQAKELYEHALELWDNPDIRWNLALVLEDLGQYLRAYLQLDGALRRGDALGAEPLRAIRDRMRALETRRLAWIEAFSDQPGADITLDGHPWFSGATSQRKLVEPGEHYVAARKAGYFSVIRTVAVKAGQRASVSLAMDADRIIETRRWSVWKPWVAVSAGAIAVAVGAALERKALMHRDVAAQSLVSSCSLPTGCAPTSSGSYDRAVTDSRFAMGAFIAGGTTLAVGLTLAWLNQLHTHRTEARVPARIEITPLLSPSQAGVSAGLRF